MLRRALFLAGMAVTLGAVPAMAQNAAAGGVLFKQRCAMCHADKPGAKATLAPNLSGVGGRQAGATPFAYSTALKNSKLTWNAKTLDTFLTAPNKMVPGTRMIIPVPDAKQRADVVGYLMSLKK